MASPTNCGNVQELRVAWIDESVPPVWLEDWLVERPEFRWSGSFTANRQDLTRLASLAPDLVLVGRGAISDVSMRLLRRIMVMMPAAQIFLLVDGDKTAKSALRTRRNARASLTLGAALKRSIHERIQGSSVVSVAPVISGTSTAEQNGLGISASGLTSREHEVLAMLARGARYKDIAVALGLSYHTVHTHLRHAFKKLQVRSVTEAALKYLSVMKAATSSNGQG